MFNALLRPFNSEIRSIYSGGRLFPESFTRLKQVLRSPRVVIDIGIADGTPELWAAFPSSTYKYLLIEANPAYSEQLEIFGKKMNAAVEKVFCGDHDGEESFITRESGDRGKASKYERKTDSAKRSILPCFTLDTILKKRGFSGPYILKVDVEGAELDVLHGAEEALKATEAVIIEATVILRNENSATFGGIVAHLYERGFALFDIAEISYHKKSRYLNLMNLIFIRKDNEIRSFY